MCLTGEGCCSDEDCVGNRECHGYSNACEAPNDVDGACSTLSPTMSPSSSPSRGAPPGDELWVGANLNVSLLQSDAFDQGLFFEYLALFLGIPVEFFALVDDFCAEGEL